MDRTVLPEALRPFTEFVIAAVGALLIFTVGWLVSKWLHRLLLRVALARQLDRSLAMFLAALAQYAVLVAVVIAALGRVGVETTSVVALFASAGLAVGLALQGSLANFASGVLLLLFRPMVIGDTVTAGGHSGKVEEIGLFATNLLSPANELIVIPNGQVTGGSIINHTARGTRRAAIEIGVAYGASIEAVSAALLLAAARTGRVLKDPAPRVIMSGFGASSLDFVVHAWSTVDDFLTMQDELRRAIYEALNAANIEIPFPQLVVHKAA